MFKFISLFTLIIFTNIALGQESLVSNDNQSSTMQITMNPMIQKILENRISELSDKPTVDLEKEINGYRIMIYNGDKDTAKEKSFEIHKILPNVSVNIKFESPDYKVLAGYYSSYEDAKKDFDKIKYQYTKAIIRRDTFKQRMVINQ